VAAKLKKFLQIVYVLLVIGFTLIAATSLVSSKFWPFNINDNHRLICYLFFVSIFNKHLSALSSALMVMNIPFVMKPFSAFIFLACYVSAITIGLIIGGFCKSAIE
jgi:hypothetical protein